MRGLTRLFCLLAVASCGAPSGIRHHAARGSLGPYSGAVETGELVFLAGKVGERGGTFVEEAHSAIDAVEAELGALGLDLQDVVSATVFLTDLERYDELNEVYAQRVPAPYPARACVGVTALPGAARVEIQVVARR